MRRKKNGDKQTQYREELLRLIQEVARDRRLLGDFFTDLFTPAELNEFASRWQIVQRLHGDVSQRDIVGELGVAVATVTRGSRMLQNPRGGFRQVLKKYHRK